MIKRICSKCGRVYDADLGGCNCKQSKLANLERIKYIKKNKKPYDYNDSFYNGIGWRKCSRYIRTRDYNTDRLQHYIYFTAKNGIEFKDKLMQLTLNDLYLNIDDDGTITKKIINDRLLVHHIIPREENKDRWYDFDNLISVFNFAHEFIHSCYLNEKRKQIMQDILFNAVQHPIVKEWNDYDDY